LLNIYRERHKKKGHLAFKLPHPGRSLKTPLDRLSARHFMEELPPSEKEVKPMKMCAVCCKTNGRRKATSVWCKDCAVVCVLRIVSRSATPKPNCKQVKIL
jgi:hypothetical protein